MMWLVAAAGVFTSPAPPKGGREAVGVWTSSTLRVERSADFSLQAEGERYGQAAHIYGTWSDPQKTPSAYILLGTGDRSSVRTVNLYVRGRGKYRVQVFLQKDGRLHMAQAVVEAKDSWTPVSVSTAHTVEVIGGLPERPGVSFPFKVVILPYMDKETGEVSRVFDLYVSPVFVVR